jgi:GR25 family glycosyltransferase involved in LPS biosynthesis
VFVVHTRRLTARRIALRGALDRFGWTSRWVEHPDPDEIGLLERLRRRVHPRLNSNEISVYYKHTAVLREIAAQRESPALVLEDDPVFPDAFGPAFEASLARVPADFDLIFFGASCGMEAAALPDNPLFGAADRTRSMSAFLVTTRCAALLASALSRQAISEPVDLAVDRLIRTHGLRAYWSVPALVPNGSETGQVERSIVDGAWRHSGAMRPVRAIAGWFSRR